MLPIPLNLEKVALSRVLRYMIDLVPGIIIVAALGMAFPEYFHQFMSVPELGYYSKLSLLLAAAYLIGFVLDELVTMIVGFIFGVLAALLFKSEKRRKVIDALLLAVAPWRDVNWQKLASAYLGPTLSPGQDAEPQWRFWYLVIKAGVPRLEERFTRRSMLADAVQTCAWALLIARIIVPGHRYLAALVVLTIICFIISGVNKLMVVGTSFGYFASDLTGADLGAAMLDEIRKERKIEAK